MPRRRVPLRSRSSRLGWTTPFLVRTIPNYQCSPDSLGTAVLPPEAIRAVLIQTLKGEEPDEGRLFWLPLNGKGYVERH